MPVQGSLETRFRESTSDYADVLHTGVIKKAKTKAVQSGLRQLIDDTTKGVLILKTGNSVLCWLTGIPSSREDYMGTAIRYAIALQDEPRKMWEWAGILCRLYSDDEQMQSFGSYLDKFIGDNPCVTLTQNFDEIADHLKQSKDQFDQTQWQIPAGSKFVLASYLAESDEDISSVISKSDTVFWNDGDKGAFWNGIGFNEYVYKKKNGR